MSAEDNFNDALTDELMHIGVLHKSGRYPWGSGSTPHQRNQGFLDYVDGLSKQGLNDGDIAQGMGITVTQLRAAKSIAKTEQRASRQTQAQMLKDKGMSNIAIGERMGLNESTVRTLLDPAAKARNDMLQSTSNVLKDQLAEKGYIDIGAGVEHHMGVSRQKLLTSVAVLKEEGYEVQYVKVPQLGTGKETTVMVLRRPDVDWSEVARNPDKIGSVAAYSEDNGRSFNKIKPPLNIDSKRLEVRYAEDGGSDMDGVMQIRRDVNDLSLGGARYAQVRVAVDGSHYLKGMAMYTDDLPKGVDIRFNTNKSDTGNKLDALKKMKDDPENPFGAVIRQIQDKPSPDGKVTSAMNIVNEEGDWNKWSKSISSQVLSKQSPSLARQQLDLRFKEKQQEFDEIMALTNPAVKKRLLESFSDDLDSSAVHLKAAALPRQRTQVILPINSLKDNEVYAPNFRNGEKVALVRYPHGGIFEIPELTVNNKNREANSVIQGAKDAIGIHAKVASRLSGADFDGDTVLVIPNPNRAIKTSAPLAGLKDFDPQTAYPAYEGMKAMSPRTKQLKMGDVSNLITDMTIKGATQSELARAVRHSMVVIDAEKHKLNWQQSAKDNGISELKKKYQGDSRAGASTLISKASSTVRVAERKARPASEGGGIDKLTGEKKYVTTGTTYTNRAGNEVIKTIKSSKMAETRDAFNLSSGTPMETVYANYANGMKSMANTARKEMVNIKPAPYSPTARKTYANEVGSLTAKLNVAQKNAPLERRAQLLANATVKAKRDANPSMDNAELKKVKNLALEEARNRVGARKNRVDIQPNEWQAIQAGAISNNRLDQILSNADLDRVKELATPRDRPVMTDVKVARANALAASGATPSEIADTLGVSVSTLRNYL
jgi:DNA-binding CsgD family transcriptional regulator